MANVGDNLLELPIALATLISPRSRGRVVFLKRGEKRSPATIACPAERWSGIKAVAPPRVWQFITATSWPLYAPRDRANSRGRRTLGCDGRSITLYALLLYFQRGNDPADFSFFVPFRTRKNTKEVTN